MSIELMCAQPIQHPSFVSKHTKAMWKPKMQQTRALTNRCFLVCLWQKVRNVYCERQRRERREIDVLRAKISGILADFGPGITRLPETFCEIPNAGNAQAREGVIFGAPPAKTLRELRAPEARAKKIWHIKGEKYGILVDFRFWDRA